MSMNGSSVSDILALTNVLVAKKENDREFQDVLNEMSATLAELKEHFERKEDSAALEAMKDMAEAMREAAKAMASAKPPTVTVQAPAGASGNWKKLKVEFDTAANGFIKGATIERA